MLMTPRTRQHTVVDADNRGGRTQVFGGNFNGSGDLDHASFRDGLLPVR